MIDAVFKKTSGYFAFIGWLIILNLLVFDADATTCAAVFTDAATAHRSGGTISFDEFSEIFDSDTVLDIAIGTDLSSASCRNNNSCTYSGSPSASFILPTFIFSNSTQAKTVGMNENESAIDQGDFADIVLQQNSRLTIANTNSDTHIDEIRIAGNSRLTLGSGVYWIDSLTLLDNANFDVSAGAKVTVYLNDLVLGENTRFNIDGSEEQLAVIVMNNMTVTRNSQLRGFFYVQHSFSLGQNTSLFGAISATNITLGESARLHNRVSQVDNAEFDGLCSANAPQEYLMCDSVNRSSNNERGALIDSGGRTGDYTNDELPANCSFLIEQNANDRITLSFSEFNYQDSSDFVSVYDGSNSSAPLLAELTNNVLPSDLEASSGSMFITSSTDSTGVLPGFQATWQTQKCSEQGTVSAVALRIDSAGSVSEITQTSTARDIYNAWLAAGSPPTGLIDNGTYNIDASGSARVDRYDFGGRVGSFSSTVPYPGFGIVGGDNGDHFLLKTEGLLHLPAGDYTIYVESNDGFDFILTTVAGDDVVFNKFGSSTSGASNQLIFEGTSGNTATGGSFTLTQDSTFEIDTIVFEGVGTTFMEVGISNSIQTSTNLADYEVLRAGALGNKVGMGPCYEAPASLVLEYQFEESSYNGTNAEVIDSSGNDFHATVLANSAINTFDRAIPGNPGTCAYVNQNNGSIEVTDLPFDIQTEGVKTTATFWMKWDGTNNSMPMGWERHSILIANGHIGFSTWANDIYGLSSLGFEDTWRHVALEFTNGNVAENRIYIDGVEQSLTQRQGTPTNGNTRVHRDLRIGGITNDNTQGFHGLIDEFRLYRGTLSSAEIQSIMAETRPCNIPPAAHHYEIVHDGQALTCEAENITINACANAECSSLSSLATSVQLNGNGVALGTASFVGTTTISASNTVAETLALSISNPSVPAENPFECDNGTDSSCNIVFADAGFRFLSGGNTIIPNQTAGVVFNNPLSLQAVQNNNGACTSLFSGNVNVQLSQENVNPGGVSGLSFSVAGAGIAKHSGSTSLTLNFGSNGIATIPTPIYHDAGQIRLHANYNVGGVSLSGSTNPFWVSPAQLRIRAQNGGTDLDGNSAVATRVHPAGDNFSLQIEALSGASPALVTQNYQPGQMQFKLTRTGPTLAGSADGALSYGNASNILSSLNASFQDVSVAAFSNGTYSFNAANYSEVGLINLEAQDRNYGSSGIVIPSTAINIGRFIPKYFEQTIADNGALVATCGFNVSFHAYSGQRNESNTSLGAITYLNNPVLEITARNAQGNITQNYYQDSQGSANDFMKLRVSDIAVVAPSADGNARGLDNNLLPLTSNMVLGTLSQNDLTDLPNISALPRGVLHYQFSASDHYYYNRSANALVDPFVADIDFQISSIFDTDNVGATTTTAASPMGVEIRFGRMVLENSFGPETENLSQQIQLEHFDSGRFRLSNDNNCQSVDAGRITLSNITLNPNSSSVLGGLSSVIAGRSSAIEYSAVGEGNTGQMGVNYDAFDWLEYDWSGNGMFDDDPSAVITFGIYRGDERLLHWRENF